MASMESRMRRRVLLSVCLCLLISLGSANLKKSDVSGTKPQKLHIAYLGTNVQTGPNAQALTVSRHQSILATVFTSPTAAQKSIVYNYKQSFSGFAAVLTDDQASALREHPDVISVFESRIRPLATTFSWQYLGLNSSSPDNVWNKAHFGDNVIIGLLDTGVWPESESFSDEGLGPIPSKWKGSCETEDGVVCNKKLIGAKSLLKGSGITESVRDIAGHGSHTASTAGGSPVANASLFGIAEGTAVGGAPKARIAMYKVCTDTGCSDADLLAAFDEGIADGVDLFSVSIGGFADENLFADSIAIGSFHALQNNILVVAAAGNDGPEVSTAVNTAPWILTVAASTIPRDFVAAITLGNGEVVQGTAINTFTQQKTSYPLISASSCSDIEPKRLKGKIAICQFSEGDDDTVRDAGGAGLIAILPDKFAAVAFAFEAAISIVTAAQATTIHSYIKSTKNSTAHIARTAPVYNLHPAPQTISFSSRGPALQTPQVLKPDLTAPGVDILAAWSPKAPIGSEVDSRVSNFNIISGTSMATPHVAGAAALIKALHPDWSPQAIKSALITTATPLNESLDGNSDRAYAFGAGQINPNAAADPGLIYDAGVEDHTQFLCAIGLTSEQVGIITGSKASCSEVGKGLQPRDLNYPSVTFIRTGTTGKVSATRTVTNVGPAGSVYNLISVESPSGAELSITPTQLAFTTQGQSLPFTITVDLRNFVKVYDFGSFTWADQNGHRVRSAVSVSLN